MTGERTPRAGLTTYWESTPEAARQTDEEPWLAALIGLVTFVLLGTVVALLVT